MNCPFNKEYFIFETLWICGNVFRILVDNKTYAITLLGLLIIPRLLFEYIHIDICIHVYTYIYLYIYIYIYIYIIHNCIYYIHQYIKFIIYLYILQSPAAVLDKNFHLHFFQS